MLQKTLAECKYDSRFEVANQKVILVFYHNFVQIILTSGHTQVPIFLSSNRFLRNVYVTSSLLKAGDSMFTKQSHFTPLLARCPLESLVTLNSAYEVVRESIEVRNQFSIIALTILMYPLLCFSRILTTRLWTRTSSSSFSPIPAYIMSRWSTMRQTSPQGRDSASSERWVSRTRTP